MLIIHVVSGKPIKRILNGLQDIYGRLHIDDNMYGDGELTATETLVSGDTWTDGKQRGT